MEVEVRQAPPATASLRVRADEAKPPAPARVDPPSAPETEAPRHAPTVPLTRRLPENVAGMLCYVLGWVSGLAFLLLDRRPFVRFHAAQSVAVFAPLQIILLVMGGFLLETIFPGLGGVLLALRRIVELVWLVAAVFLMLKAASGERYRLGVAGAYAERAARDGN